MQVLSLAPVPVSSLLWRRGSTPWQLSVICKTTLQVRHGKLALARSHDPIHGKELEHPKDRNVLRHAADVVPGHDGISITVSGLAYGRPEQNEVQARIVMGKFERSQTVALEQGTGPISGWGPIAATSPERRKTLGTHALPATEDGQLQLAADFPLAFFHPSPPTQRIDALAPNELVHLENLHPDEPETTLKLPDILPQLFVQRDGRREEIPMQIQAVHIDTRRTAICINWCGNISLESPNQKGRAYLAIAGAGRRMTQKQLGELIQSLGGDGLIDDPPTIDSEQDTDAANQTLSIRLDTEASEDNRLDNLRQAFGSGRRATSDTVSEDFTVVSDELSMAKASKQANVPAWLQRTETPSPTPASSVGNKAPTTTGKARAAFSPASGPKSKQPSVTPWDPPSAPAAPAVTLSPSQSQPKLEQEETIEPPVLTPRTLAPPPLPTPTPSSKPAVGPPAARSLSPSVPPPAEPHLSTATGPLPIAPPLPTTGRSEARPARPSQAPPPPRRGPLPSQPKAPIAAGAGDAEKPPATDAKDPRSSKHNKAKRQPSRPIDLLWFDQAATALLRHRWPELAHDLAFSPRDHKHDLPAEAPDLARDHHTHFGLLVGSTATDFAQMEEVMRNAVSDDGRFTPPLVAMAGTLQMHFDDGERLRALTSVLKPYAGDDRKLEKALSRVEELLEKESGSISSSGSTQRHLLAVYSQGKHALSSKHIKENVDRLLLQERRYDTRVLFGSEWIRCTLESPSTENNKQTVVAYLPSELKKRLPLMNTFEARLLAEAHPQQDVQEPFAQALKVLTLGRYLSF